MSDTSPVLDFRRSSFCSSGSCLEVATAGDMYIRDSKLADSPVLRFTREEWTAFVAGVKAGEFDS